MRNRSFALGLAILFAASGTVQAEGWLFQNWAKGFKRNRVWPHPFVCPDRLSVSEPLDAMVAKGWQSENTLHPMHFVLSSGELTEAGKSRILRILNDNPPNRRMVFVPRATLPEETVARMRSVQGFLGDTSVEGDAPLVAVANPPTHNWNSQQVDHVRRGMREASPAPILPSSSGGSDE